MYLSDSKADDSNSEDDGSASCLSAETNESEGSLSNNPTDFDQNIIESKIVRTRPKRIRREYPCTEAQKNFVRTK